MQKDREFSYTSYAEFDKKVMSFRASLSAMGVGKGDVVAAISNNRLEWVVGMYVIWPRGSMESYVRSAARGRLEVHYKFGRQSALRFERYHLPARKRFSALENVLCFEHNSFKDLLEQNAFHKVEAPPSKNDVAA